MWYNVDEKRKFYDTLQRIKPKAGDRLVSGRRRWIRYLQERKHKHLTAHKYQLKQGTAKYNRAV